MSHCVLYMLPTVSTVSPSATWKMKLAYQSNYFVEHTGLKFFESSILIFIHLYQFLKICLDFFIIYLLHKVKRIYEDSLDLVPSSLPSVKIKIMGRKGVKAKHCWRLSTNFWKQKVCWYCPAMFCLYTFPSIIWIFTEG